MKQGTLQEGLISSLGGSRENPASLFPLLESEKELTTAVTSGQRCLQLSESLNRPLSLAKMLLVSSVWKMAKHLTGYCLTWKMKATRQNNLLFQLAVSGRGTGGTEFGLLPTSQARDYKGADINPDSKRFSKKTELNSYVTMFPTPTSVDYKSRGQGSKQIGLDNYMKLYPTVRSNEYKGSGGYGSKAQKKMLDKDYLCAVVTEIEQTPTGGTLNPQWVEWLMGYPIGWTDLKG